MHYWKIINSWCLVAVIFVLLGCNGGGATPGKTNSQGIFDYEINHIFTYGQSLSVGQATPALSTIQNYDNLMFYRGMRPQFDYPGEAPDIWYKSLVPAIEQLSPQLPILAETPSMGTGDMIKERILAENGLAFLEQKYQILLSAPGCGDTTIEQLSKGGAHFSRMVEQASYGKALANAAGNTYAVQAVTWTQGESDYILDTRRADYIAALNQLIADINSDVKTATGQTKNIRMISYQISTHKTVGRTVPAIALAQWDVVKQNPNMFIATPTYHFEYADGWHLNNFSSRWLGAYYGLAYKRIVIDGEDWKPVSPEELTQRGNEITIRFHVPVGPLVLDTINVAYNLNYGFEVVDAEGASVAISSVTIIDSNRVKIVCNVNIPAGAKVRYAWNGAGINGPEDGPRGNLRDSQGDAIRFDPKGINKPMHNWCIIFEEGVSGSP